MRPLVKVIDLSALRHNLAHLQTIAGNAQVMAVIKANAYGHGVEAVLPALSEAKQFGVACIEEALELRALGVKQPITLLEGVFSPDELAVCVREALTVIVHNQTQLAWLAEQPQYHLSAWLKIDSGMSRLGFQAREAAEAIAAAQALKHIDWLGLATHFACADEPDNDYSEQQWAQFSAIALPSGWQRCAANSAALLRLPHTHADVVRPGLALYGMSPMAGTTAADHGLRAVMTLRSKILTIRTLQAGEYAGYGCAFRASKTGRLATIALGYGDGFPRKITSGAVFVRINGQLYPLVGRVTMDMALVWLGEDQAAVGDEVVIFGDGHAVEAVAEQAGTIPYTMTTMLTSRPHTEVVDG
ncbi:alanine racemase [Suttonella sp. R2A3]|uniref:alanine racemase n=1 Tax=Suttonella sp. R2A3 TaxID=2908648 RepID=UPI001F2720E4|nr:alanine racemase [Suttonella sp. R2A3]UJF24301.1 alanine racemase [Suttonella sp. R2A3]